MGCFIEGICIYTAVLKRIPLFFTQKILKLSTWTDTRLYILLHLAMFSLVALLQEHNPAKTQSLRHINLPEIQVSISGNLMRVLLILHYQLHISTTVYLV